MAGVSDSGAAGYVLPPEENQRIFQRDIVPDLLDGREQKERPTAVFLIGQHGAGKTRVADMVAEQLNKQGGFADIDTDLYKPYHPRYAEVMELDDRLMAAYTGPDGRAWMDQAQDWVRENKVNVLIQETAQDGGYLAETMQKYRAAGFRVEALCLGVSEAMSQQGVVNRYHEQVKDTGRGRLPVAEKMELAYRGILDGARLIDEQRLADQVAVFRRGEGAPRYSNALTAGGQWQQPPALREAIETERARPWTETESGDFLRVQGKLQAEMGPDWTSRLEQIGRLAEPRISPLSLLPDSELASYHARLTQAAEAASQLAHPEGQGAPVSEVPQRLLEQTEPAVADRARRSAAEDQQYAQRQAVQAQGRVGRLLEGTHRTAGEIERRSQLTPQQRQAEQTARQQLQSTRPAQQPAPAPAPRLQGPQQPGRGQSL